MNILQSATCTEFLSIARNVTTTIDPAVATAFFQRFIDSPSLQSKTASIVFLSDLTRRRYICLHKAIQKLTSITSDVYLDGDLDFYYESMPKE